MNDEWTIGVIGMTAMPEVRLAREAEVAGDPGVTAKSSCIAGRVRGGL